MELQKKILLSQIEAYEQMERETARKVRREHGFLPRPPGGWRNKRRGTDVPLRRHSERSHLTSNKGQKDLLCCGEGFCLAPPRMEL